MPLDHTSICMPHTLCIVEVCVELGKKEEEVTKDTTSYGSRAKMENGSEADT